MESRAKLAGHPIHPMLIVFPLGLLATAVIFDIICLYSNNPRWSEVAFYMIGAGVIGGVLAAVFGAIDWFAIPNGTRAKSVGLWHAFLNVVVLILFAVSWYLRYPNPASPTNTAYTLGFAGALIALVSGWLGGELVDRLGVGVDEGANVDAPSSLSGLPAGEMRRYGKRAPGAV